MLPCCQLGVSVLVVVCLIFQAVMVFSYDVPPLYYSSWSKEASSADSSSSSSSSIPKSSPISHRSRIGPRPHLNDVMTEWSGWGSWTRCSRSCGGGVRSRTRTCITTYPRVMPGSGVRTTHDQCGGESIEYDVCATKSCPPGQVSALSFRAAQCRHYNNRRVFGRVVNNWVPYTQGVGGMNPCALVCEGEGEGIVYTFGKVTDGTHCKTDDSQDGLCVNGRCLRLSCDGRLGGRAKEDMCRVCGGHNETCTRHVGVFHTDLPSADQPTSGVMRTRNLTPRRYGYYEVSRIPRGATNVKVTDSSANFLALKAGNKFILNGDWLIDWPGEVDAGGVSFTYTRSEDDSERLESLGPTSENLTLMVLLREHNPGIHYEYWIPNNDNDQGSVVVIPHGTSNGTSSKDPTPRRTIDRTSHQTTSTTTTTTATETTITTETTTTSTTTPRPAILTSVNVTRRRFNRPSKKRPSYNDVFRLPDKTSPSSRKMSSDNETHKKPLLPEKPRKKPRKKPIKEPNKDAKEPKDKTRRKGKKDKKRKGKKKKQEKYKIPASCEPCQKPNKAKQQFCTSDFVSRVEIINSEPVAGERRYEVLVHQSYKNKIPLLHKEFLWVDNECFCPKMRHGRSYLVMGMTQMTSGREVRLVLTNGSYVRRYKPRNLARILRIRHNEMRYCRPWRRDLRFFQPPSPTESNYILADAKPNATAVLLTKT